MSKLTDLIQSVQERDLTKPQLEDYYQAFLGLFSTIELSIADLEKEEAIYIDSSQEKSDAARVRKWKATEGGQKLIEYKRKSKVIEKQMSSVKHRLYQIY